MLFKFLTGISQLWSILCSLCCNIATLACTMSLKSVSRPGYRVLIPIDLINRIRESEMLNL